MRHLKLGFDAKRLVANRTGLGNYSRFVLRALLRFHPEHTYYLFAPNKGDESLYADIASHSSVRMVFPKGRLKGSFWRTFGIPKLVSKLGLDVYHGLSNELPVGIGNDVFKLVTMHDLIYERFPKAYKPIDRFFYHLKYKRACTSLSDVIVSVSKMTANDLQKYYHIPEGKIKVIYQGCRSMFYESVSKQAVDKALEELNIKRPYFLSVGTFEWRKNFGLTVEALDKLPKEYKVVIVGRATEYGRKIMKVASDKGLSDRVVRPSYLTDDQLKALYAGAEVFVYPSRFEGFGIPIIESLAMGVPVVAARGSCLEEAGGAGAFYIDPDNVDELVEKLNLLISDSDQRLKMSEAGREHIKRFADKLIADQINALYLEGVTSKN